MLGASLVWTATLAALWSLRERPAATVEATPGRDTLGPAAPHTPTDDPHLASL